MNLDKTRPSIRQSVISFAVLICCNVFLPQPLMAAELRVDFNQTGRPLTETQDPAFTPWSTNQSWFPGGANTIAQTFSGVTVRFTRVGSQGTALQTDWYASGIQTAGFNAKLVSDGITVAGGNAGAQIEMRISGLAAGAHTVLAYLNTWQNPATHTFSPLNISVNGVQVISNLPVSNRVTNNADAATAYLSFNAVSGQDVVILFAAVTSGSQTDKNVCIDGFEIDTPNSKFQATKPVPANADEHVNADTHTFTLGWTAAATAVSHDVYLGTTSNSVATATRTSSQFKGNQTSTSFNATSLSSLATYYWRIDEINSTNGVTKGNVWYFRPRHIAFPGAEGYGRFARGGRGGVVVEVSNLNDSGPGSLRNALTGNFGPRTVVFTISGLITLGSDLTIDGNNRYITVAGQTAPGKGICTRAYPFGMSGGRDVIIRHVRSRPGNIAGVTLNGSGMSGSDHCIMDHVSISWGIDEELSTRTSKNVTFQRSLISEALNIAGHNNYPPGTEHGYAATIGGDVGSFHHNLLAHNEGRNWSLGGGLDANGFYAGRLDIFNNVVYNWGNRTTDGGAHEVNFVNNYYKPGAASSIFVALNAQYDGFPGTQQYYFAGNVMPGHFTWSSQTSGRTASGNVPTSYSPWTNAPFFPSYATIQTVTNAYKYVLSDVGCTQPVIDDHDKRVIRETFTGTFTYTGTGPFGGSPGLPNSQDDVGGWENYPTVSRPANFDTDHDGMPDWWERMKGFNTNSAAGDFSESNGDPDGDEYTNLEDYLNWLADPHTTTTVNTAVDVALTNYTAGFASSATYTVNTPVNGTVSLVNGKTGRFTPNANFSGLGSFNFVVNDGITAMTNKIAAAVMGSAASPPPASPTALMASGGNAVVNLTWIQSVSPGITQNKIYRSTNGSGGPYNLLITLSPSTSYVDTAVVNGNQYFYSASAVNNNGESVVSAYSGATPGAPQPPSAPTGLNATAGNALVSLSWTASSGATSYRVKRATVSGGPYSNIATNTSTTYTNTGLINGTTYYYVVSAVNANGESANSSQVNAKPGISTTIQAESGTFGGGVTIDSNNAGFNGTGFANFPTTGGFLQFSNINGGSGGAGTLTIRYALGITTSRTGQLVVNSTTNSITFNPSGAWTTWTNKVVNITLNSGTANTIRFQSNGQDMGNIDQIIVTQ